MSNSGEFRTSLFGFNKKDVVEYITSLKNEYYAFRQQSEKERQELYNTIFNLKNEREKNSDPEIFDHEQAKLLNEMEEEKADTESKIDKSAERLESLIDEIEALINKTENN